MGEMHIFFVGKMQVFQCTLINILHGPIKGSTFLKPILWDVLFLHIGQRVPTCT